MRGRRWLSFGLLVAVLMAAPVAWAQSTSAGSTSTTSSDQPRPSESDWDQIPVTPAPADGEASGGGHGPVTATPELQDWAVVVVAGDWRSSHGQPIQAFENSRRDLSAAFVRAGFRQDNMVALSMAPNADGTSLGAQRAFAAIEGVTRAAPAGCLLYFTSHGSPAGIVFGPEGSIAPSLMNRMVDTWCGARPTVVVVSACFSGVFVPALAQSNRMIMTAARRDRSSFGCSEDDTHPYFDACVLESLDHAVDFLTLSQRTTACVNRREREENLRPPSEPQTYVGAEMQALLPFLRFSSQ